MTSGLIQEALFDAALKLLPPSIRRDLLNDSLFLDQWSISTITFVTLNEDGPSFRRDWLYESWRAALRDQGQEVTIRDANDATWNLIVQPTSSTLEFSIYDGTTRFSITDHSALAEDVAVRTNWFDRTAKEIHFEESVYHHWLDHLNGKPLSDDEFAELMADIQLTPVSIYGSLLTSMQRGKADVATLIPSERCYYERLVGGLGSSTKVEEYIESGAKPLIADLQGWSAMQGFLYALLTCSAGVISEGLRIEDLSHEELIQAYQWLVEHGDPVSRVAAVETALIHLDTHPELTPFVERIVEEFISEDSKSDSSSVMLLSSVIIIVASELTRKCTLRDTPPFYRKQAAIAQASLIVRAINVSGIDPESATQWACSLGVGHNFFLQGLIDLRSEPRWLPDFVNADQLRAEFIGRIVNIAERNADKIHTDSLRTLLLGPNSKIASASRWPFPNFPGPLEGAITPRLSIPDEVMNEVRESLEADRLEANSFAGLVNTALLFDLPESQSSLAASALHRVKFSIENADDEGTTFSLIGGLAVVAAVTRGTDLADALHILVRVLRRRKRISSDPDGEMRIAMIAAASFENLEDWAKFSGEWITEMAFELKDKDAAKKLLFNLRRLIQLEPTLVPHCTKADAALSAFSY